MVLGATFKSKRMSSVAYSKNSKSIAFVGQKAAQFWK